MKMRMVACGAVSAILLVAGCGRQEKAAETAARQPSATQDVAVTPTPPGTEVVPPERLEIDLASVPAGGHCSLDAINGAPATAVTMTVGDEASFEGWVSDGRGQVPQVALLVLSRDGAAYANPLRMDVQRPDVAQALDSPGLAQSGFGLSTALDIEPGLYGLSVLIGAPAEARCQFAAQLTLVAP